MKNFIVALGPIVVVTPERNMRLPMANKARSKKRNFSSNLEIREARFVSYSDYC
jgi:hypothetical protein